MYEAGVDASLSSALATLALLIIGSSLVGAASATARMEARKRATGANNIVKEKGNLEGNLGGNLEGKNREKKGKKARGGVGDR